MCDFCEEKTSIDEHHMEISYYEGIQSLTIEYSGEWESYTTNMYIKFCPICGKNLQEVSK